MAKADIFLWFCLSFIFGIFLNSFLIGLTKLLFFIGLWVFVLALLIFIFKPFKAGILLMAVFCFLFILCGAWRHWAASRALERPELAILKEMAVDFKVLAIEAPETDFKKSKTVILAEDLDFKILLYASLYPEIEYGDRLRIQGILEEPPVFEGFNYRDYLKNQGIYFVIYYPQIEIIQKNQGSWSKTVLLDFKNQFKQSLGRTVSFNQAGFFEALLFGDEENISEAWKEKLNATGTRHLAAVSGMNITIISLMVLNFFLALGLWRQQAFWLTLVFIGFYVLMIGAPACAVRAGIMGALFLISQQVGRISQPGRLLALALTAMLAFDPLLLKNDVGFQLSFLAVMGLIYLGPYLNKVLKKVPDWGELRLNLVATLAAQAMVLPLLLYNFSQVSLISPLANILILPLIPFLTVWGFLISAVGLFSLVLARVLAWPGQVSMLYVLKIIDFSSRVPGATKQVSVSGIFVVFSYLALGAFVFYLNKKRKLEFLDY